MESEEEMAVKNLIEEAYIKGIHGIQDEKVAKSGFHKDFAMLVLRDNAIERWNVDQWLERIPKMKERNPKLWEAKTTHQFAFVDVSGNAAVAKLNVYKGDTHFSTDYMLLYKFREGWRIVSKIFT
jgi:hypothetical protein